MENCLKTYILLSNASTVLSQMKLYLSKYQKQTSWCCNYLNTYWILCANNWLKQQTFGGGCQRREWKELYSFNRACKIYSRGLIISEALRFDDWNGKKPCFQDITNWRGHPSFVSIHWNVGYVCRGLWFSKYLGDE